MHSSGGLRLGLNALIIGVVTLLTPTTARAANSFDPATPQISASFETIGFIIPFVGDDNGNAAVAVDYRQVGSSTWISIHDAVRTPDRSGTTPPVQDVTFSGRAFWLTENTDYELRFWYSDPDGVVGSTPEIISPIRTRASLEPETQTTYYVDPALGNDDNPGSLGAPWRTLVSTGRHGQNEVGPGTRVVLRGGVYNEPRVRIRNDYSGDPNHWIVFEAYPGERPIVDGSDPALRVPGQGNWIQHPSVNGIWYTDVSDSQTYHDDPPRVSWGSDQLWLAPYFEAEGHTLQDMIADESGLGHGWHHDTDGSEGLGTDKLFVWLPGNTNPNNVPMWVARTSYLMYFEQASYVAVEGITFRHAFHCLSAFYSPFPLFRDNTVHSCIYGIEIRHEETEGAIVENNEVFDLGIVDDPPQGPDGPLWNWIKSHTDTERQGIKVRDVGPNAVIRNNYVHEVFNGAQFEDRTESALKNFEVYGNRMVNIADDAFEPEGNMINSAFWDNQIEGALVGISLAPVHVGPVFILYNKVVDFWIRSVKLNHGYGLGPGPGEYIGLGKILIYQNTFVTTNGPSSDNSDYDGLRIPGYTGGHDITTRNNIWQATARVADDTNVPGSSEETNKFRNMDYDCFWTTNTEVYAKWWSEEYDDFDAWRAGSCGDPTGCVETNGLSVDPLFVDASTSTPPDLKDLRLIGSSPLIDQGLILPGINDFGPFAYVGDGPDMGALEHGAETALFNDGFESGGVAAWSIVVP